MGFAKLSKNTKILTLAGGVLVLIACYVVGLAGLYLLNEPAGTPVAAGTLVFPSETSVPTISAHSNTLTASPPSTESATSTTEVSAVSPTALDTVSPPAVTDVPPASTSTTSIDASTGATFISHLPIISPSGGYNIIERRGKVEGVERWTFGNLYVVTEDLTIQDDATLFIEPGVIVKLIGRSTQLYVNGTLQAEGTAENAIVFTSLHDDSVGGDTDQDGGAEAPLPGDWDSVYFRDQSQDGQSSMIFVEFRYGGGGEGGPVYLENASPTLQSLAMGKNNSNGIHLAATTWGSNYWKTVGTPHIILDDLTIDERATITIGPGVVIKLRGRAVQIYVEGAIVAQGDMTSKIIFTSLYDDSILGDTNNDVDAQVPLPGDWDAVYLRDQSRDSESNLNHVVFYYGGGGDGGPVYLDNASPSLSNLTMEKNNANGTQIASKTWGSAHLQVAGVPYVFLDDVSLDARSTMTIDPGVIIKVKGSWIQFYIYGVLHAEGFPDAPITFTSINDDSLGGDTNNDGTDTAPLPDDWDGLVFRDSVSSGSLLKNVRVLYGSEQPVRVDDSNPDLSGVTIGP
jgi:hypothetical protein